MCVCVCVWGHNRGKTLYLVTYIHGGLSSWATINRFCCTSVSTRQMTLAVVAVVTVAIDRVDYHSYQLTN